ncbi:MAG: hypothetical protein [Microvirus sp.]|nr:MAG: hypothetical protein [Microvirus sp.]
MSMFKNNTNGNKWERQHEKNIQPSMTIPDQTMSISEIMRRFASGLPLGGMRVPEYDGEDDLLEGINPKTLDLSEIHDLKQEFAQEILEIKKKGDKGKEKPAPKQLTIEDVETIIKKSKETPLE